MSSSGYRRCKGPLDLSSFNQLATQNQAGQCAIDQVGKGLVTDGFVYALLTTTARKTENRPGPGIACDGLLILQIFNDVGAKTSSSLYLTDILKDTMMEGMPRCHELTARGLL